MAGLLRQRDVRLIVGAVGVSSIGDFLLWVPLTLYLQRTSGSAFHLRLLDGGYDGRPR